MRILELQNEIKVNALTENNAMWCFNHEPQPFYFKPHGKQRGVGWLFYAHLLMELLQERLMGLEKGL